MNVRLLRGRVIVRPIPNDYGQRLIRIPDNAKIDDPREDTERAKRGGRSLGRGIVVAMGPPAFTARACRVCGGHPADKRDSLPCWRCNGIGRVATNVESMPDFAVGDEVMFLGQHISRDVLWGEDVCKAVAQEEIALVFTEHTRLDLK